MLLHKHIHSFLTYGIDKVYKTFVGLSDEAFESDKHHLCWLARKTTSLKIKGVKIWWWGEEVNLPDVCFASSSSLLLRLVARGWISRSQHNTPESPATSFFSFFQLPTVRLHLWLMEAPGLWRWYLWLCCTNSSSTISVLLKMYDPTFVHLDVSCFWEIYEKAWHPAKTSHCNWDD